MPRQSFGLMHVIRTMSRAYQADRRIDGQLLSQYAESHDQTAFATLMARHGTMVWNICRSILGNDADAEDAYQAAFMALAAKCSKIQVKDTLAGWLCQAARRSALHDRRAKKSRKKLQAHLQRQSPSDVASEAVAIEQDETSSVLLEELAGLPEKQRVVLVLHYLEGKHLEEIADILGVKKASVCDRLARGRVHLQDRLTKRGLALGATTLTALLEASLSQAIPPHRLVVQAVKAATAFRDGELTSGIAKLATEVLRHTPASTPFWKTGWMIALLCVGGLGAGFGGAWKAGLFLGTKGDSPHAVQRQDAPAGKVAASSKPPRVDAYGDPLPAHAVARIGTRRLWYRGERPSLLFSPQSDILASYGGGRQMPPVIWDVATGKEICRLHDPAVDDPTVFLSNTSLAFFPDGRTVATATTFYGQKTSKHYQQVQLWETATGRLLHTYELLKTPSGPLYLAFGGNVVVLPSGEILVLVWAQGVLWVWEATAGKKICQLEYTSDDAASLILSPNGKFAAACKRLPQPVQKIPDPNVTCDSTITVWNAVTGKVMHRTTVKLKRQQWPNAELAFSADGKALAVGHYGLWEVASGKQLQSLAARGATKDGPDPLAKWGVSEVIAYSADCNTWYMIERLVKGTASYLWDVAAHKARPFNDSFTTTGEMKAAFSPNGKILAATGHGPVDAGSREVSPPGAIQLWNLATGETVGFRPGSRGVFNDLAFSDDGMTLVSARNSFARFSRDAACKLESWSTRTGKEVRKPISMAGWKGCATPLLLPGGAELLLREEFAPMTLHSAASGQVIRKYAPNLNMPPALSPDGSLVAALAGQRLAADPPMVHVWNVATGGEACKLPAARNNFSNDWYCVFSSDNKTLVLPGESKCNAWLWDLTAQKMIRRLGEECKQPTPAMPTMIPKVFSPDGRVLVAGYGEWVDVDRMSERCVWTTILLEAATGKKIGQLPLSAYDFQGGVDWRPLFVFTPDGMTLATTGRTTGRHVGTSVRNEIQLWDVYTGRQICQLKGHQDTIRSLVFSRNGRMLASSSDDTTALIWDMTFLGQDPAFADGRSGAKSMAAKDIELAWHDLGNSDPNKAYRGIWVLKQAAPQAVPLLKARVQPVVAHADAEELEKWIADLNSDRFATRRKAEQTLEKLGDLAIPALKRALKGQMPIDARLRTENLLAKLENGPVRQLRALRAVQVLEYIGTPPAREVLKRLAQGLPEARLTRQAQGALDRMSKPSSVEP